MTQLLTNRTAKLPVEPGKRHWSTYAKGERKVRGEMNKTEIAFHNEFILGLVAAGLVTWWEYELCSYALSDPSPNANAKRIHYVPDFHILYEGYMQVYEVKGTGIITEASLMRVKLLADLVPYRVFIATQQRKANGGGFKIEEY